MSFTRLVEQVQEVIKKMINSLFPWIKINSQTWPEVVETLGVYKPKIHYHKVVWSKPGVGQVKCNIDGASKGNSGLSSYGFCITDDKGDLIYARAKGLGVSTNTEEESLAIKQALEYCYEENIIDFIIEINSLSLKKMILNQWKIPWELAKTMEEIRDYIQKLNIIIIHAFKEGNTVVDSLANEVIESQGMKEFYKFQQLSVQTRKLININKAQILHIRIKTRKIIQ